jgi:GNAT superfamily N-acetyltransferase
LSKAFQKANGKLFPFGFIYILKAMKKNDRVDLYLVAVRPDLQSKGVNSLLFKELIKIYIKNKFKKAESNPELETNLKVQAQWKYFDRRQHRRRRCFIKYLDNRKEI